MCIFLSAVLAVKAFNQFTLGDVFSDHVKQGALINVCCGGAYRELFIVATAFEWLRSFLTLALSIGPASRTATDNSVAEAQSRMNPKRGAPIFGGIGNLSVALDIAAQS